MNHIAQRAHLLIDQRRWSLAEAELRRGLSEDSQNPDFHRLLAYCLVEIKRYDEAEEEARTTIGLAPDQSESHRMLALVLANRRKYREAEAAAVQAVEFDPFNVEAFATLAGIRCARDDWQGTLAASEQGLQLDPEHNECNNFRALALVRLGRREEAGQTLESALARNPEDAFTHANRGWSLLASGKQEQAFEHFREALANNPESEWGREGIVEAMKARNILYRWMLQFFLYMSRFKPGTQWMIMIGGFLLQRMLADFADKNPALAPYCLPLLISYIVFALLTWLASPLFNLLLLTDRLGRRTLSVDQTRQGLSVAAVLLSAAIVLVVSVAFGGSELSSLGRTSALFLALTSLPASMIFVCASGWPRYAMLICSAALGTIAMMPCLIWIYSVTSPEGPSFIVAMALSLTKLFVPCFIGSQFLAMSLVRATPVR